MSKGISEIFSAIVRSLRGPDAAPGKVSIALSEDMLGSSIYARKLHPSIFQSVLADGAPDEEEADRRANGGAMPTSPQESKRLLVGEKLKAANEAIIGAGEQLAELSSEPIAHYVRRLMQLIEAQHCQIAFIGQMNAGKSTLINAFIGSPRFLPAEITPWTTVVTNLYFGVPKLPRGGAVFEFFDEDEWDRLADGSGRVRTLTKELMPNFPWENLYDQVGKMKRRAEEKLGPRYEELLGQQHTFQTITPDLLEKYIAAESPLAESLDTAGEFSMITKAAHLYFDLSSFFYPTVVIDTPGINDPFLVRDEITRQNLERANIQVIVVTARQPLSEADLDLVRILRGLKKENFIIFVNKADEIEDFEAHSGAIVERIRMLLAREFPSANIPIITGSAQWAEVALSGDQDEIAAIAQANNIMPAHGLIGQSENPFWLSDAGLKDTLLSEAVLARSGILDLALAVSDILRNGPIAQRARYAVCALTAISRNGQRRAEAVAALAETLDAAGDVATPGRAEIAERIGRNLDDAKTNRDLAAQIIEETERNYAEIVDSCRVKLVEALRQDFDIEALLFPKDGDAPAPVALHHVKGFFPSRLRMLLEEAYLGAFHVLLLQANLIADEAQRQIQTQIDAAADKLDLAVEMPPLPLLKSSPSVAALAEPMPTEFVGAGQVRKSALPLEGSGNGELLAAVNAQFETIVEKLARSAEEELRTTASFVLDHFRATALGTLESVINAKKAILDACEAAPIAQHAELSSSSQQGPNGLSDLRAQAETFRRVEASLASIAIANEGDAEPASPRAGAT
jgi:GTP-binding protein EngB required for normal cell division